jgi:SulP family sulfate permease
MNLFSRGLNNNFVPEIFFSLKNYSFRLLYSDFFSAVVVALAGLPLAMSYALSIGIPPHYGLYCTIVAGLVSSFFSGARCHINGPTAGFEGFAIAILAVHGMNGMFTTLLLAGLVLVMLGLTGLGVIVKFIARPIVLGISNGIGLFLILTQIKGMLGLQVPGWVKMNVLEKLSATVTYFHTISSPTTVLSIIGLICMVLFQKHLKRLPGALIVTIAASFIVALFALPVATIGSVNKIPQGFTIEQWPVFQIGLVPELISPAFSIALLIALKTLLTAAVADRMMGAKHNPNMELIAQGLGNMASSFVGAMPSTASISRTANNIRTGGRTPIAGILTSVVLLSVVLFASTAAEQIPLCILAAIMALVGYNMGEWHSIPLILKLTKADIAVWALTFILSTLGYVEAAMKFGFLLAAALYVQKVSATTTIGDESELLLDENETSDQVRDCPEGARIFSIRGPFLFGTTDRLSNVLDHLSELPPVIILRLKSMTAIDATGVQAFETLAKQLQEQGKHLIVCALREQPAKLLKQANFDHLVGLENHCLTTRDAVTRAREILESMQPISNKEQELSSALV